jgi:2-dehydropantoate 2-reductase
MRILIAGAGAIGSVVSAPLAMAGHRLALLARPAYVEYLRSNDLIITTGNRTDGYYGVPADERVDPLIATLGGVDLVIVSTKVYDTKEVCRAVRGTVRDHGATVLVLQNGLGGDAIAAEVLGDVPIVSGVITWVVSTVALGEYEVRSRRRGLGLAPYTGNRQSRFLEPSRRLGQPTGVLVNALARMFRRAGIRCRAYDDTRAMRWSKLLLNMLGNAVPAILDLPPSAMFADERLYSLERAAFLEAVAVMRAGAIPVVNLPGYPVRTLVSLMERLPERLSRPLMARLIAGGRSGKAPSLQIDAQRGRTRSEVTALNGAVAREGERLGVPTPANAAIRDALLGILSGRVPRESLLHNSPALVAWAKERGWGGP